MKILEMSTHLKSIADGKALERPIACTFRKEEDDEEEERRGGKVEEPVEKRRYTIVEDDNLDLHGGHVHQEALSAVPDAR